jgi:phenylacetate-CoA ligase
MGLDFKAKDFAYPISILKLKRTFAKNQWLQKEELYTYQLARFKRIIDHCCKNIPYYQELFKRNGIKAGDIQKLEDLKIIPFLTRDDLISYNNSLLAKNAKLYRPQWITTSGTTGGQVRLCMDKPSNVLEFVYYWRAWGWAGYKIGDTFAELSAQHFTPYENKLNALCDFEHISRRLLVNSLLMSGDNVSDYIRVFKKFRPQFLKGLPSNLYIMALLLNMRKDHGIRFKAIFSQGENLLNYQRAMIEKVFSCKVYDAYGHMERTVAISQCPVGSYHVHSDYGLAEFLPATDVSPMPVTDEEYIAEITGTSLYNFSMPLLRYRTRDYVKMKRHPQKCRCGRGFSTVISVLGRDSDVVITPDGRAITALYVAFDRLPNVIFGQILQKKREELIVNVAYLSGTNIELSNNLLLRNVRDFVGNSLNIKVLNLNPEDIRASKPEKFRVVVSEIPPEKILS